MHLALMPVLARRARRWLLCGLFCFPAGLFAQAPQPAQAAAGVGLAKLTLTDPVGGKPMPGYVFYPASASTAVTGIGAYAVDAAFDAPAQPGAHPLVVISHGHGGSALGHHDLASFLARHGMVVATLEHPGDNCHDTGGTGTPAVLGGRARQVSATIDAVLASPRWGALVDPARIGVAGFSAGGYTSLLLVGARPRFVRFMDYCTRYPDDTDNCEAVRRMSPAALAEAVDGLQAGIGRWGDTADPRVRAAFAMAPLGIPFDAEGLAGIHVPVRLTYGSRDHVLVPQENAARIAPLIPSLDAVRSVVGADHWVFLAPCSATLAQEAGPICRDPEGIDRVAIHRQLNADALAFFARTLAAAGTDGTH